MKKLLFTLVLFFSFHISQAQFSFGGGLSYDVLDDFGVKLLVSSDVNEEWRGQVSYSYFFSDWTLDFDAQYKLVEFDVDYDQGFIFPFVGLNIHDDEVDQDTDIGINLGLHANAGFENYRIFLEPKLTLGGIGGIVISAGVMF